MDKTRTLRKPGGFQAAGVNPRWLAVLAVACVVVVILGARVPRPGGNKAPQASDQLWTVSRSPSSSEPRPSRSRPPAPVSDSSAQPGAGEIVAKKLASFCTNRLAITCAMARKYNVVVSPEVERFFAAVQAGNWDEVTNRFESLRKTRSDQGDEALQKLWSPILETFGVAEEVHNWPAQRLLDYGQAVLGSLRPGTAYVGGTDPGRFIPTLLNETSDGEHRIVLTQNALADNTYLQYVNFLYADRMGTIGDEDSQTAFKDYLADAQKRLAHDQQFPNEPKQIMPGEDVRISDNRVQVSGQVAVMAINERLLTMIMDKNPDLSFALEESFPLKSTYAAATPLGPIMELRTPDAQLAFSPERAGQAVDYWRGETQQLLGDSETPEGSDPRKAYGKMAAAQAALLANHQYPAEAEQTYRFATDICPGCPEAVFQYANLLVGQNRAADAMPVIEKAIAADPENEQFRALLKQVKNMGNH